MRVTKKIEDIDYQNTKNFFKRRAGKFKDTNPYSVTMYQDNNVELVAKRNKQEIQKIKPLLGIQEETKVLDIACGIGRWADAIVEPVEEYCGIDFSGELIQIAKERNQRENFFFYEGSVSEIEKILQLNNKSKFNVILLMGILMYINDADIDDFFTQVERQCETNAKICIREPIGLFDRLTLKDFYSEDLQDSYNAIYRTKEELMKFLDKGFLERGFIIEEEGFLFEEGGLNNRKETSQYYFILSRQQ